MLDSSGVVFRPLQEADINHAEHLLAAAVNPEIFALLCGREQKVATASALVVRLYCDSKVNTFMSGDADCIDSWMEPSQSLHHVTLTRAIARKLGEEHSERAQDQSLHDMTIEIAGDIARQATAINILHAYRTGTAISKDCDAMIADAAGKSGVIKEIEFEAAGDYHRLPFDAQEQVRDSIKSGQDIAFDFEPLLDKTLTAMTAVTEPVMVLSDELPNNSPANLQVAGQILNGLSNAHPQILRGLSVTEAFIATESRAGMGEHYKLQALARAVGLAQASEAHGRKFTEEMAARTMLSDIRLMHSANLGIRGQQGAYTEDQKLIFRGEYAHISPEHRNRVFRTLDLSANIAPEEKLEIHARCEHERNLDRARSFTRAHQLSPPSASIGY